MKRPLKVLCWVFVILLVCASPLIYIGTLNYFGYCIKENRFISDREKIEAAFNRINRATIIDIGVMGKNGTRSRPLVKYKDLNEFLEKNPNCCSVGMKNLSGRPWSDTDGIMPPTFESKTVGAYADVVGLVYDVRYIDDDGSIKTKHAREAYHIGNCGVANPGY